MPDYKTPQLSYYYSHRAERSAYARAYYIAKKQNTEAEETKKRLSLIEQDMQDIKKLLVELNSMRTLNAN
jgi:hypothetical protein